MSQRININLEAIERTWFYDDCDVVATHYRQPYTLKPNESLVLCVDYDSLSSIGVDQARVQDSDDLYVSVWVVSKEHVDSKFLKMCQGMELNYVGYLQTRSVRTLFKDKLTATTWSVTIDIDDTRVELYPNQFSRLLSHYVGWLDVLTIQRELTPSLFSVDRTEKMVIRGVDGTLLLTPEFPFENVVDLRASIDTSVEIGKTYKVVYGKPEKFTLTVIRHSKLVFEVTAIDF